MNELNIDENYLDVIKPALEKAKEKKSPVIAMKIGRKKFLQYRSHRSDWMLYFLKSFNPMWVGLLS